MVNDNMHAVVLSKQETRSNVNYSAAGCFVLRMCYMLTKSKYGHFRVSNADVTQAYANTFVEQLQESIREAEETRQSNLDNAASMT